MPVCFSATKCFYFKTLITLVLLLSSNCIFSSTTMQAGTNIHQFMNNLLAPGIFIASGYMLKANITKDACLPSLENMGIVAIALLVWDCLLRCNFAYSITLFNKKVLFYQWVNRKVLRYIYVR